ncbi:MAG: TlyA family RNA methyltransferase [Acidobacteria bacterium]|nr:TlyA family RNA methyltransferase [Acidobacteriota bacterium]
MTERSPAPTAAGPDGYASRGGAKLASALDAFALDVAGLRALDAGASSGGFTDCLLQRGAAEVWAVDVAYGQLAWRLRNDPRVRVLERMNVRWLSPAVAGEPVDLVVADLSFISLRTVRDALLGVLRPGGDLVLLVKPQFELPRARVPRGGVVRDPGGWQEAMRAVEAAYREAGCTFAGAAPSPRPGPKGNREFFLHLTAAAVPAQRGRGGSPPEDPGDAEDAIARAAREAP